MILTCVARLGNLGKKTPTISRQGLIPDFRSRSRTDRETYPIAGNP
jgi:hypothetical protein